MPSSWSWFLAVQESRSPRRDDWLGLNDISMSLISPYLPAGTQHSWTRELIGLVKPLA